MIRSRLVGILMSTLLAGCAAPAGASIETTGPNPSAESVATVLPAPPLRVLPVDPNLSAVSLANPSAEAKAAMDLCVRAGDTVAGMAYLDSARDVRKYMLTNGNEPELQTDKPAWIIQFSGAWTFRNWTAYNPVCVVVDGVRMIFAPYGTAADGPAWSPPADFVWPTVALPPLAK